MHKNCPFCGDSVNISDCPEDGKARIFHKTNENCFISQIVFEYLNAAEVALSWDQRKYGKYNTIEAYSKHLQIIKNCQLRKKNNEVFNE